MAKPKVSIVKKSKQAFSGASAKSGPVKADTFIFVDNEDDTCTVFGVDAAGAQADISTVATLTVTSSNLTVITVDPPIGATFKMHGLKPGNSVVTATATWNDGSVGPFTFDLPCEVKPGPISGLVIVPGTPVVR